MSLAGLTEVGHLEVRLSAERVVILTDLVESWARHVLRLYEDASLARRRDDPKVWNVHDLVGAMYIRDRLETALKAPIMGGRRLVVVEVTDELFRTFTVEDGQRRLLRCAPDVPTEPWWWRRIPNRGPIFDEIQNL